MDFKKNKKLYIGVIAAFIGLCGLCTVCGVFGALFGSTSTPKVEVVRFDEEEPSNTPVPTETLVPTNTPEPSPTAIELPPEPTWTPVDTPASTQLSPDTPASIPPTDTPAPTVPSVPVVVIAAVDKGAEYVDIQNIGGAPQDLTGWRLVSEKGPQECPLSGIIGPGETITIWALAEDADKGGFSCGYDGPIWNNNEKDPAVLYDAAGMEVDRK